MKMFIPFDPQKHPRGTHGHFTNALSGLETGSHVKLPDGVKVTKKANTFHVTGGPKHEGFPKESHYKEPEIAAEAALTRSAMHTDKASLGGSKPHDSLSSALRVNRRKARKSAKSNDTVVHASSSGESRSEKRRRQRLEEGTNLTRDR
jgi:hypothetical protein